MLQQAVASRRDEQRPGPHLRRRHDRIPESPPRRGSGGDATALLDGPRRAHARRHQREMDSLESHLNFLASAGSVSPYIGLLGTVWGIMHAFIGLSNMQQATLASVAPASPRR